METSVLLLHEYSMCFYNLFGFCSQLYGIYICCVFEPKLLRNQQDDVTNCVFGHVTMFRAKQQKGPNLEQKIGKLKRVDLSELSQIFNSEFLSNNLFTDKKLCSCHKYIIIIYNLFL